MKKRALTTVAFVVILIVLGASASQGQGKGPIKLGFITALTGPAAANGMDMQMGIRLYLEEIGYQASGRKIELITEDDEGLPTTSMTKVRKLVEKDGVHTLTGVLSTACGYAIAPYLDSKEIPTTYPVVSGDDLTQRKPPKWVVRTGYTSSQPSHPLGEYAFKVLKYRTVDTIGLDFSFGWENVGGFQRTFEELGGRVNKKLWVPVTIADFSPYLTQFSKNADAVLAIVSGRSGMQFVKQYQDYGLKAKIPVIGSLITDEHALPSMGDEALGIITALHYSGALDNPANKKFVKAYRAKAKKSPSYFSEATYTGTRWVIEAIKAVNGNVEDKARLLDALKKVRLQDVPRGPLTLDPYLNPIQNIYIRKVERVGSELQNTVIHTYPNVSQFWTYKPEEFLKQPVYSRDFPPLKP